jgi:dephospho-CoA kinase
MKVIGLTGSIASGKSEVARILRAKGFGVFDADAEVHRIYADGSGAQALSNLAPTAIAGNHVDRDVLSQAIAADPALLARIEARIHPLVREARQLFLDQQRKAGASLSLLDIPLLFETGQDREVDATLVIVTTPELQESRALQRPGMTREKLAMIRARQMPDNEKRRRATIIIENNGTISQLEAETEKALAVLLKHKAGKNA